MNIATARRTRFYFFERKAYKGVVVGWTVSKKPKLPKGDFRIREYKWPDLSLWFVSKDKFTADERQSAYIAWRIRKGR